jgi:hypothetical protein
MDDLISDIAKYVADNTDSLNEADKLLYQLHDIVLDYLEDNYGF